MPRGRRRVRLVPRRRRHAPLVSLQHLDASLGSASTHGALKAAAGQHGLISTSRGSPKAALAAASSLAIRRRRLLQPYVDGRCKSTSKCVQSLITEKGEGLIKITLRLGRSAERTFYPCRRPLYSSPASFSAPKKFELRVRETNEEPPRNLMQQNTYTGPPGRPRARNFTPEAARPSELARPRDAGAAPREPPPVPGRGG